MYNLILQLILMGSLGVIVYLLALTIPRVEGPHIFEGKIKRVFSRVPLKKVDESINFYKDKTLRKFRLFILRLDNVISRALHKDKDDN